MNLKLSFIAGITLFGLTQLLFTVNAQPTNNPIAGYYDGEEGYPSWTEDIVWDNVIDMSTYEEGNNAFEKFENARDELANQGGGVLYYPAGTYDFSDHPTGPNGRGLKLKPGVVIRGEQPSSDKDAVKSWDSYGLSSLETTFDFGSNSAQAFIGTTPADATGVGIAWVEIQHGYIHMGFDASAWADTWSAGSSWLTDRVVGNWGDRIPDGTFIMDPWAGDGTDGTYDSGDALYGSKRFVFGCRLENAYIRNYIINKADCDNFSEDDESWRFGGVISMYGAHLFVANNAMPSAGGERDNRICLDVNKQLLALYQNRCDVKNNAGLYAEDVVVRDNWFYNQGNKTYELAGNWMVARDNKANKDYIDLVGFSTCDGDKPTDDYMNRGMDLGGINAWVHNNEVKYTGSAANDGEGILGQRHNAVEIFSHAWTDNYAEASSKDADGKGYIAPYDMHCMGFMSFNNTSATGDVGIDKPQHSEFGDISMVNNSPASECTEELESGIFEIPDCMNTCPGSTPATPSDVTVTPSTYGNIITWTDNASDEIGFRVDRRIDGGSAHTIAYRPRNSNGADDLTYEAGGGGGETDCAISSGYDFNEQKWVDYLVPAGISTVEYRVVAVNCNDNGGTSDWKSGKVVRVSETKTSTKINVYPTLTDGMVHIDNAEGAVIRVISVTNTVYQQTTIENGVIDISNLPAGMYIIRVETDQGVSAHKVIKE